MRMGYGSLKKMILRSNRRRELVRTAKNDAFFSDIAAKIREQEDVYLIA